MKKGKFQFIANGIRPKITENNKPLGTLYNWVKQVEGDSRAKDVQKWSETCEQGSYYNGEKFEIIRID